MYEKETKITHYTLQYLKQLNNTTKTMPREAKDYDYPTSLRKKKNIEILKKEDEKKRSLPFSLVVHSS